MFSILTLVFKVSVALEIGLQN